MSGGIAIFWKNSISASVVFQSANLVDMQVVFNGISLYLSYVYGYPDPRFRHLLQERLERTSTTKSDPWLIMGDFNEIKGNEEKKGGPRRPERTFTDFRRMINTCDFHDLKSVGDKFTWTGKHYNYDVWCCLDRTMGNSQWLATFPSAQTEFLPFEGLDHMPLVTNICSIIEQRKSMFRYDSRHFQNADFRNQVIRTWKGGNVHQSLQIRIQKSRKKMADWKRHNRLNASVQIGLLKTKLNQTLTNGNITTQEIDRIIIDLNQAYKDEEHFWKMKSRNNWIKLWDINTKFFYAITKQRIARNRIMAIEDD